MSWPTDLLALAKWAIESEDLRHRFLYADTPLDLARTSGIGNTLETNVVLSIYEAAVAKGYRREKTIDYERAYPGSSGVNPKRADLAFKDPGQGKNWGYVEVKCYGPSGKDHIANTIEKLRGIKERSQRWVLCYRVRPMVGKAPTLKKLIGKHFRSELAYHGKRVVPTITEKGKKGACEIILARVKER